MPKSAFTAADVPLTGHTLIEASAGTGKTYAITELYLRLLLETEYSVSQILVLTYTNAATAELRARIRSRLAAERAALEGGDGEAGLRRKLELAIESFDEAAIHTIHGFCQRVLGDEAFESAEPFAFELAPYRSDVLLEVVKDFWRRRVETAGALFGDYVRELGESPVRLAGWLDRHVGKPFLRIEGGEAAESVDELESKFRDCFTAAQAAWIASRDELVESLCDTNALRKNQYKPTQITQRAHVVDVVFAAPQPHLWDVAQAAYFCSSKLRLATKKNELTPQHGAFDLLDELLTTVELLVDRFGMRFAALRRDLLSEAEAELEERARGQGIKFYDDLMNHLVRSLQATRGDELAQRLCERYPAALIDEFQDTDPVQLELIERIYLDRSSPVVFVGDPKQAIYGFRGADVFAYLRGRALCEHVFGLEVNYRSTKAIVGGINRLFSLHDEPFVVADIAFTAVRAHSQPRAQLELDGFDAASIQLLALSQDGKRMTTGVAAGAAASAFAREIAALIDAGEDGRARIGGRSLGGGDIAILVRSHRQARIMHQALRGEGVSAVYRSNADVFQSRECEQLCQVLAACLDPSVSTVTRAALVTDLIGYNATTLLELDEHPAQQEAVTQEFFEVQRLWRDFGFGRGFRYLMGSFRIAQTLLARVDGEQRLANLMHLGEYLTDVSVELSLGCEGLFTWLGERIAAPTASDEAAAVRADTDEQMVQIVTVHGSKGLEYPVVFCPFTWSSTARTSEQGSVNYHLSGQDDYQAMLHLGPVIPELAQEAAESEARAEDVRLLYVALTRAQHRLYLSCAHVRDYEKSALAWLLHRRQGETYSEFVPRIKEAGAAEIEQDVQKLVASSRGTMAAFGGTDGQLSLLKRPRDGRIGARESTGTIQPSAFITSHSGIVSGYHREAPDHDGLAAPRDQAPLVTDAQSVYAFPRGPVAGTCLHRVLEDIDFSNVDPPAMLETVSAALLHYGIEPRWAELVSEWLHDVLNTPLDADGVMTLAGVGENALRREIEFYYPVRTHDRRTLGALLESFGFDRGGSSAGFDITTEGYLKGYIDLVFEFEGRYYVADYKSNWLGSSVEDYRTEHLAASMHDSAYDLQALIYGVALHRFLRARLRDYDPTTHFGGIAYLYLRGMSSATGPTRGVYWVHPAPTALDAVEAALCGE